MVFVLYGYFHSSPNWGKIWGNFSDGILYFALILAWFCPRERAFLLYFCFFKSGLGESFVSKLPSRPLGAEIPPKNGCRP